MDPSPSSRRHVGSSLGGLLAVGVFAVAVLLTTGDSGGARRDVAERFLELVFVEDNLGTAAELVDPARPLSDPTTLSSFTEPLRDHVGAVTELSVALAQGSAGGQEPDESRFDYCVQGETGAVTGALLVRRLPAGDLGVRRVVADVTGTPAEDGRCAPR